MIRHSSGPPGGARRLRSRDRNPAGKRDYNLKEIRSMSGPMSERAPDIMVEADGRAESTTVL
jgi:hypothetical protein